MARITRLGTALLLLLGWNVQAQSFRVNIGIDTNYLHNVSSLYAEGMLAITNGFALVGSIVGQDSTNRYHQSAYVMEVNTQGQVLRFDEYEDQDPFIFQGPRAYGICHDGQSSYYIAGSTNLRQVILKVGDAGAMHWARAQHHHDFYSIICSNAGATFLGQDESQLGFHDFSISQLDADGNGGMGMMYGTADFEVPEKMIQPSGGGYLLSGLSSLGADFRVMLVRVDDALQMVWGYIYADTVNNAKLTPKTVHELNDGYLVGGFVQATTSGALDSVFVMKTDTAGQVQWARIYGNATFERLVLEDMVLSPSGDIYFACSARDTGYYFPVVVQLDPSGQWVRTLSLDDADGNTEELLRSVAWKEGQLFGLGERTTVLPNLSIEKDIFFLRFDDTLAVGCQDYVPFGTRNLTLATLTGIMSQPYQITDTMLFGFQAGLTVQSQTCFIPVSIDKGMDPTKGLYFQNPAPRNWAVRYDLPEGDGLIEFLDLQGRVLFHTVLPDAKGEWQFDLNSLPSGLYFVRASGEGWRTKTERVLLLD